jgi:hypothetical protein
MNKLFVGIGIGLLTLVFGVTILNANSTFEDFSPMADSDTEEAYYPSRYGSPGGRCHGAYSEETSHFHEHDWMFRSMFSESEIEHYNQMGSTLREEFEIMYARRVNALDTDSMDDKALRDKLDVITQNIFETLKEVGSNE